MRIYEDAQETSENRLLQRGFDMQNALELKINEIVSQMTLNEKIGQLVQLSAPIDEAGKERLKNRIRNGNVGSVILAVSSTAGNDAQRDTEVEVYNELQRVAVEESRMGIPVIFGRDVIHGHRTVMPIPLASAGSFNPELVKKCYACVAKEAANDGVQWAFSPMVDVCHDPRWGRIIEGPGEDPYLASVMAHAIIKGFQGEDYSQKDRLAACVKHYLGYGASEGGRDYHRTELSDYTLYNLILPPFRAAVDAGVATVMSSFNDINGQPVTSSKKYLTDILRGYLNFKGFVVSDWAAIANLRRQGVAETEAECAAMALKAGLDMDMVDEYYSNHLQTLVRSGEVSEALIDNAVRNVLRVKLSKGLFEDPYIHKKGYDRDGHLRMAYELAAESMVLLKNDNHTLPLAKTAKIALAGPFKQERRALLGSWVLDGKEEETPHFHEALESALRDCEGAVICNADDITEDAAEKVFAQGDVIVLAFGESHLVSGERHSLADIVLTEHQISLARRAHNTGKPVIGVVFCGRPLALQTVEPYLDAILCAWHCGSATAAAAADILLGNIVPSGKIAVTFVKTTGHIPLYYNATPSALANNGYYNQHPEECYLDIPARPMYPFGYGLSYTDFACSPILCDKTDMTLKELKTGACFSLTVNLSNTGNYDGRETLQLYIRDKVASVMRPMRELKAFQKVLLAAGESRQIHFTVGYDQLGFYKEDGEYVVEPGAFDIYIGDNCLTENSISILVKP